MRIEKRAVVCNSCGRVLLSLVTGLVVGIILCFVGIIMVHSTSRSNFCLSCHEMEAAGKDWRTSVHYSNKQGVVAECRDCHINPGLTEELKAKFTSGLRDMLTHIFQKPQATPEVRAEWRKMVRTSIKDESCENCHKVLIPPGISKGGIIAHLAYRRSRKTLGLKCITCHYHRFHGPKPAYGTL